LRKVTGYPERREVMVARVRARYDWDAVGESYARLAEGKPAVYSPVAVNRSLPREVA
jgi:hypothetical protein